MPHPWLLVVGCWLRPAPVVHSWPGCAIVFRITRGLPFDVGRLSACSTLAFLVGYALGSVWKYAHELGSPVFGLRSRLLFYRSTAISRVPWVCFAIRLPGGDRAPARTFGRFDSDGYRNGGPSIVPWICPPAPRRPRYRACPR